VYYSVGDDDEEEGEVVENFSVKITLTIRLKDRHYKNFTESIEIFLSHILSDSHSL
jgi:hypothetical protein